MNNSETYFNEETYEGIHNKMEWKEFLGTFEELHNLYPNIKLVGEAHYMTTVRRLTSILYDEIVGLYNTYDKYVVEKKPVYHGRYSSIVGDLVRFKTLSYRLDSYKRALNEAKEDLKTFEGTRYRIKYSEVIVTW